MFEIPDDDDDEQFWNDIDVTMETSLPASSKENRPRLRVPQSTCAANIVKSICADSRSIQDDAAISHQSESPCMISRQNGDSSNTNKPLALANKVDNNNPPPVNRSTGSVVTPCSTPGQVRQVTSRGSEGQTRRKRKFPGPAGLLPQLGPGQGLEMLSTTSPVQLDGQQQQVEVVIPASQSSEDQFSEVPWQTLMSDLDKDGAGLMQRFSIANILINAGKKQLQQGKALFVFGLIENLETHGSEASVTIKDQSGKMQGTIHRDLLKEYESELQPGTVLVLKQVSIISVSQRNHYLNITPTNMVALYHNRGDSLKSLSFHGSQDSLYSVLLALEASSAASRRRSLDTSVTLTPGSHSGLSALSSRGSSASTPVQRSLNTPGHQTPVNSRLFNTGLAPSPANPTSFRDTSVTSPYIRDVSVVNNISYRPLLSNNKPNNGSHSNTDLHRGISSGHNTSVNMPESSLSRNIYSLQEPNERNIQQQNGGTTTGHVAMATSSVTQKHVSHGSPSLTQTFGLGCYGNIDSRQSSSLNQSDKLNSCSLQNSRLRRDTQSLPVTPTSLNNSLLSDTPTATGSKWKFKSPTVNKNTSPPSVNKTSLPADAGVVRQCQLGSANQTTLDGSGLDAMDTSDMVILDTKTGDRTRSEGKICKMSAEDLWEDDLSDELLSQLSDEMT